jgi:hypothetical protein
MLSLLKSLIQPSFHHPVRNLTSLAFELVLGIRILNIIEEPLR